VSIQAADSVGKALSNNLHRQLAQYSLTAAVAGVSMLALAAPASGEVVVTRKTIPIPVGSSIENPVTISMANDGVNNFSFLLNGLSDSPRELVAGARNGTNSQILAGGTFYTKALALSRGAKVGPSANFVSGGSLFALVEATSSSSIRGFFSRGYWGGNPKNKYLGVRFQIRGQFHYGWIRLTVTSNVQLERPTLAATITGWAYESVANKPIKAGTAATAASVEKPTARVQQLHNQEAGPSLGMLAAGAEGMPIWRR
jgi:hypothetical protein